MVKFEESCHEYNIIISKIKDLQKLTILANMQDRQGELYSTATIQSPSGNRGGKMAQLKSQVNNGLVQRERRGEPEEPGDLDAFNEVDDSSESAWIQSRFACRREAQEAREA